MKVKKFPLAQKSSKSFPAPPLALLALSAAGPSVLWGYQNSQVPAEKNNITNQVLLKELIFNHREHAYFRKVILRDQHSMNPQKALPGNKEKAFLVTALFTQPLTRSLHEPWTITLVTPDLFSKYLVSSGCFIPQVADCISGNTVGKKTSFQ